MSIIPTPSDCQLKDGGIAVIDPRDEVSGQPVIMRAMPRSRFRNTFSEQISLPLGEAESLEQLELSLREVGFITEDQILSQRLTLPTKFVVQGRNIAVDGEYIHDATLLGCKPSPQLVGVVEERVVREFRQRQAAVMQYGKKGRRPPL